MKVQYASDLHLEFPENKQFLKTNPLKPMGDVLVLAGDIVPFKVMSQHADFFTYVSENFKTTYWIPGNHEYYYSDVTEKSGTFMEKIKENVFLINNKTVILDDVKFIFSTLWSKIRPENEWYIERGMSDFKVIKNGQFHFSSSKFNELHEACIDFLKQELAGNQANKTVVVSHHVPTLMNYPETFKNSVLNNAFTVELFDLIEASGPDAWIYGHSHVNTPDFSIGRTRLLTNQLGYVRNNEHTSFGNSTTYNLDDTIDTHDNKPIFV
ncbi:MAG TPA: metallophosphoesterase [Prolixibacteraceae bacterium]|nr:metallophosphoesterase [Prolixibacteraceae bacterium]